MKTNETILVVDDDRDFLDIIKRILKFKGFTAESVSSAAEATTLLKERFYNVAILDISLPDADGTELLSRVTAIHPDIIAIMLTGHSSVHNAVQSLNCGAFAYLEKPVDPENLFSVINRGLERQRLVMENRRLMDELSRRNRVANTLLSVSQAVSQSLDMQQIIDAALEKVAESIGLEVSFLYLHRNDKLVLMGHHGLSQLISEKIPPEVNKQGSTIGTIFTRQEPLTVEELASHPLPDLDFLRAGGYRCFAGVPLVIVGKSIGVLGVATSFARYFSPANIELLTGIVREIAIAVRNAQMYEEASSAKALRELDTMRTEFLANVSHELRTPLAVIKGSANSLLQPDVIFDEQTRREFLISIDKDADTLTRLVEDLLLMSRLEADALQVNRKPHSVMEILDSVKDRLENITVKHHLSIEIPDKIPQVLADDVRIGEVLTNLVDNAVKFSDDGTTITIETKILNKEVIISVADEGIGIPPEIQEKVFERFFQGNSHKTNRRKGSGLGLSICRGILEAHKGKIWVENKPGKGAKFCFSLPAA
jgi:K+-sensing histidine kinase KdpD